MQHLALLTDLSFKQSTQNPDSVQKNRLILHSMIQLALSNSAQRGDDYYREQWSAYYSERRRLLTRIFWLVVGLGVGFLLFSAVVEKHQLLANILAVPIVVLMLAFLAQWFIFA